MNVSLSGTWTGVMSFSPEQLDQLASITISLLQGFWFLMANFLKTLVDFTAFLCLHTTVSRYIFPLGV
jgi:hypothetical protein